MQLLAALAAAAVAAVSAAVGASSGALPEGTSSLWGKAGELWDPAGALPDFSYAGARRGWAVAILLPAPCCLWPVRAPALPSFTPPAGYMQGAEPLPAPLVTRSVLDWRAAGGDTEMLLAAVAWANAQPESAGFIVLGVPAGEWTLEQPLILTRSRTVLRGEGSAASVLHVPQSAPWRRAAVLRGASTGSAEATGAVAAREQSNQRCTRMRVQHRVPSMLTALPPPQACATSMATAPPGTAPTTSTQAGRGGVGGLCQATGGVDAAAGREAGSGLGGPGRPPLVCRLPPLSAPHPPTHQAASW